ncbi:HAD family hydrolase [Solirhodobacter olei]|uniref:sulfotransferase-like domain-containing protein n=1 Tax=Solirhodobacter olei TaxID=2493082 RepID=UPI000FD747C3|nr:HAD family hydrolase [Solirhodobacter olei]
MWSGPRNLSSAMMYAFAQRADCAVWDEPFYAAYLQASGIDHPMREAVIAAGEADAVKVAQACLGPIPQKKTLFYQKHMTLHMVPSFPRGFMRSCTNVFLIRHPARVVASYAKKREAPTLADIGFVQQAALFDEVAGWLGHAPPVIDSADILDKPLESLTKLCDALGISFDPAMLAWPAGPKPYDGAWAPVWYGALHQSTGFQQGESALPELPPAYGALAEAAMPHYERLAAHKL